MNKREGRKNTDWNMYVERAEMKGMDAPLDHD